MVHVCDTVLWSSENGETITIQDTLALLNLNTAMSRIH